MIDKKPIPPSDDKRYKALIREMKRHGYARNSLIEVLHCAQESFGFLEDDVMKFVANSLKLPLSRVYGVATFYSFFSLKPQGEHTCVVCTGTACYIKGADDILDAVYEEYGIRDGETTNDDKLSLLSARCFGSCGLAPMAIIDGKTAGYLDKDSTKEWLRGVLNG